MEELNVTKENEGFIYSIKCVSENMDKKCPQSCYYSDKSGKDACSYISDCEKLGITCEKKQFVCIKIIVNVKMIQNGLLVQRILCLLIARDIPTMELSFVGSYCLLEYQKIEQRFSLGLNWIIFNYSHLFQKVSQYQNLR